MLNKNEVYPLEVIDNGASFEGIARHKGKVVFVPGAILGEKIEGKLIKVNKDYAVARLEKVLISSRYRVVPICEVFSRCGGCSAQHIVYDMQLILKNKMVEGLLKKQQLPTDILQSTVGMGMPYYYRNKVQYPIRKTADQDITCGFYQKRSHQIIENDCCYIQDRVIDIFAKNIVDFLRESGFDGYDETTGGGDIRHLLIRRGYHTGEMMVVIVVNHPRLLKDRRFEEVAQKIMESNDSTRSIFLNLNESRSNEILGETQKKLIGSDVIQDQIGDFSYYISPKSFFQVNTLQAEVLYSILKEKLALQGNEIIFDLYSGVGSIGIFLSDIASQIYGIEIEPQAVEMANKNMVLNHVTNAEYIAGSVEDKIEEFQQRGIRPDVIVVDPPRRGLDEKSISYLLAFGAKKIGYVSCNPATLARDLRMLSEKYEISSITPVDMFPQTEHVECVVVLGRKENFES